MRENDTEDVSELEIQTKTWNKIEKNMKLIGFSEGAAKGRDQSLQEGFDLGFAAGFDLGQRLGQIKGILSCPRELTLIDDSEQNEENMKIPLDKACVMCLKEKTDTLENESEGYPDINEIISQQEKLSSEIINSFKNQSLNLYLDMT